MEPRKQAICDALTRFINQRAGLEFGNYGDVKAFRAEQRAITKDRHHAETLLRAVMSRDSITADMLVEAARHAYSGRLTLAIGARWRVDYADGTKYNATSEQDAREHWSRCAGRNDRGDGTLRSDPVAQLDYVTGQYFPTEYRRAVCAVLASALWDWTRENAMPSGPNRDGDRYWLDRPSRGGPTAKDRSNFVSAGDWLRAHFRREFGRHIAARWFS